MCDVRRINVAAGCGTEAKDGPRNCCGVSPNYRRWYLHQKKQAKQENWRRLSGIGKL